MKIPYSKKELYRDNIHLRKELDRAEASNAELVIEMERAQQLIDETNAKIIEHNILIAKYKGRCI